MSVTNTSGRRKTAVARIYLKEGNGTITVNGKDHKVYFPTFPCNTL
jgi:small subunit ribosomal protein S9